MAKTRTLNTATLDLAVQDYTAQFFQNTIYSTRNPEVAVTGREWVMQSLYNADFKDEHEYLKTRIRANLGPGARKEFDKLAEATFTPRDDAVFEALLEKKLARNPAGEIIPGAIGTTQIGSRIVGHRPKVVKLRNDREIVVMKPIAEPIFAGQEKEFGVGAQVMNISAECALLALDAIVDNLDEGTGAAVIQGRTGTQPADPDAATTGTLLFTLVMSDPAFGAAADQADGTVDAAAASITDDSSADATGTLGYCRVSATNDSITPLDDHIDGEAGTSGADFNFNTLAIVSGATVSMSSYVITLSQGSTAT